MSDANRRPSWGFPAVLVFGACCFFPFARLETRWPPPGDSSTSSTAAIPPEKSEYTLLFAGDVMLSRGVGARMQSQHDWLLPFRPIADTLHNADLRFCNLECPVSDRGHDRHHLYSFRADPRALAGLKEAGFEIVSQANNHAYDWGPEALVDTLARLRAEGIRPVGAGENALVAHYPAIMKVGSLRVAFLAYVNIDPQQATAQVDRPGVAWLDLPQVLADIRFARLLADLVIVSPHWGVEYAAKPARQQVEIAHQMIDAGADLIVGTHPHVVQPLESYRDRWIAYSLGNFVFDQKGPVTHRGLILKVTVRAKRIVDVAPLPIEINSNFQPVLAARPQRPPKPVVTETHSATAGTP